MNGHFMHFFKTKKKKKQKMIVASRSISLIFSLSIGVGRPLGGKMEIDELVVVLVLLE